MNIPNYLHKNDIKPSYQRIKIFEYLYHQMNHPTVDVIFKNLVPEIPTLSKTTVYNTLKLFVNKGITSTLTIEDNEVRYDALMIAHGHLKCNCCENIFDINVDYSTLISDKHHEFEINETHIHFKGKCKTCLTKIN